MRAMIGSTAHSRSYAVCDSALGSNVVTVDDASEALLLLLPISASLLVPLVGSAVLAGNKRFSTK